MGNLIQILFISFLQTEVRAQDSVFVMASVAINPKGRDMCWEFFKSNSAKLLAQYEVNLIFFLFNSIQIIGNICLSFQGGVLLARLVKCLTENFASEEKAQEVEKFFQENEFSGTERTVSQSVETIRLNAAWLQRDLPKITEYLSSGSN